MNKIQEEKEVWFVVAEDDAVVVPSPLAAFAEEGLCFAARGDDPMDA